VSLAKTAKPLKMPTGGKLGWAVAVSHGVEIPHRPTGRGSFGEMPDQ